MRPGEPTGLGRAGAEGADLPGGRKGRSWEADRGAGFDLRLTAIAGEPNEAAAAGV